MNKWFSVKQAAQLVGWSIETGVRRTK